MKPQRKWSVPAIVGFVIVVAFWASVFCCGGFLAACLWSFGGVLSLGGGLVCIANKGRYRGVLFAAAGFAMFAGFVGLYVSCAILFGQSFSRWADALILIGVPMGFAILAASVILVPYFLRRNRAGVR